MTGLDAVASFLRRVTPALEDALETHSTATRLVAVEDAKGVDVVEVVETPLEPFRLIESHVARGAVGAAYVTRPQPDAVFAYVLVSTPYGSDVRQARVDSVGREVRIGPWTYTITG